MLDNLKSGATVVVLITAILNDAILLLAVFKLAYSHSKQINIKEQ